MAELPECIKTFKSRIRGFFGLSSNAQKRRQQPGDAEASPSVDPTQRTTEAKPRKQEIKTVALNEEKKTVMKKKAKIRTGFFQLKPPSSSLRVKEDSIAVSIHQKTAQIQDVKVEIVREKSEVTANTAKGKPSEITGKCDSDNATKEQYVLFNKNRIQDGVASFPSGQPSTTKLVESGPTETSNIDQKAKANAHGDSLCISKEDGSNCPIDSIVIKRAAVKSICDPKKPVVNTDSSNSKHLQNDRITCTSGTTEKLMVCAWDVETATKQLFQPTAHVGEQKIPHTAEFTRNISSGTINPDEEPSRVTTENSKAQACGAVGTKNDQPRGKARPIEDQLRDLVKHIKDHKRGTIKPMEDQLRGALKPTKEKPLGINTPIQDQLHGTVKRNEATEVKYVKQADRSQHMAAGKTLNISDNGTVVNAKPEKQTGMVKDAKLRADGTFKEVKVNGIGPTRINKAHATSEYFKRVVTKEHHLKTQIPVPLPRNVDSVAKPNNTAETVGKSTVKGTSRTPAPNVKYNSKCLSRNDKGIQCELEQFTCACFVLKNGKKVLCKNCIVNVESSNDIILTAKSRAINWKLNPSGMTMGKPLKNVGNKGGKVGNSKIEVVTQRSMASQTVRQDILNETPPVSVQIPADQSESFSEDVTAETTHTDSEKTSAPFPNFQFKGDTCVSSPTSNKNPSWKTVERKQKTAKRRNNPVPTLRRPVCCHVWNPVDYTQGIQWDGCGTTPVNTPGFVPKVAIGKSPPTKSTPNYVEREVRAATKVKGKQLVGAKDFNKQENKDSMDTKDSRPKLPVVETDSTLNTANRNEMHGTLRGVEKTMSGVHAKAKNAEKNPIKKVDKLKKIWKQIKGKQKDNPEPLEVICDTGLGESAIIDPMADMFIAATTDDLDRIDGITREFTEETGLSRDSNLDLSCKNKNLSTSFADFSGTCEDLLIDTFETNMKVGKSPQHSSVSARKVLGILLDEFGMREDSDRSAADEQDKFEDETGKDRTYSTLKRSRSLEDLVSLQQVTGKPPVGGNLNCEYENPFEISGSIRIDDHYEPGKKAGRGHIAEVKVKQKRRGEANKHLQAHQEDNTTFRERVRFIVGNNDGDPGLRPVPIRRGFDENSKAEYKPDEAVTSMPDEVTQVEPLEHAAIAEPADGAGENTNCLQPLPEVNPDMRHCREIPLEVIYGKKRAEEEENRYIGPRGGKKKKGRQRGRDIVPKGRPPPLLGMKFDI